MPSHFSYGGMAERFNATVLKTVVAQVTLSSNLSPSAIVQFFELSLEIPYKSLQLGSGFFMVPE